MKLLEPSDILDRAGYEAARGDLRRRMIVERQRRRVQLGPHCTVHFESRETMQYQVHEMLRAESSWDRPGAVADELSVYNDLVPQAGELSATLMLEYETEQERARALPAFVGLDRHVKLQIGDTEPLLARFDVGQIDEHKLSSVQYIKWSLDGRRRTLLKQDGAVVRLTIDHPFYQAQAVLGEETRRAVMNDPD